MKALEHNLNLPDAERVKLHFKENKKLYQGIVIGGLVVLAIRKPVTIVNTVAPVFNNNNSSSVFLGGYLSKVVQDDITKEVWTTVKAAAEAAGVTPSNMSKHLNGATPDIFGKTYSIIGVGAGLAAA